MGNKIDYDDKDLVIIATMVLGLAAMLLLDTGAENIIGQIITGMFGIAVGKSLK